LLPVKATNPANYNLKKQEEGRGKREEGRGKREEGRGKREEGRGKREEGRGKREEGRGKRVFTFYLFPFSFPKIVSWGSGSILGQSRE